MAKLMCMQPQWDILTGFMGSPGVFFQNPGHGWLRHFPIVLGGELRETQTANYFSNFSPVDCAVPSANA